MSNTPACLAPGRQGISNNEMTTNSPPVRYDLEERLLEFTAGVIDIVESLSATRAGSHIAGQLIRCGTSPVANYAEAQSGESRKDFIHKLKITLKELRETRVWLLLIQRKVLSKTPGPLVETLNECNELTAIFWASINTAEQNKRKQQTDNGGS